MKNVILTAADGGYFVNLCQFAQSFRRQKEYEQSELICYDLGFSQEQIDYFNHKLSKQIPNISIRKFDFDQYPEFVQLSYKTYSFKPIIVREVFEEKQGNLLWLDSATILMKRLDHVWNDLDKHGVYAPIGGSGSLGEWTVQQTLDYMNVPETWLDNRNICGCMCGFAYHNRSIVSLVEEWEKYALIHECIKPEGARRDNHRDDQSLLTILLYRYQQDAGIFLTKDEVNISSAHPVDYLSVRNKLKPNFPISLIPFSTVYFLIRRRIDMAIHKLSWA